MLDKWALWFSVGLLVASTTTALLGVTGLLGFIDQFSSALAPASGWDL